jgi:hypothetical protein
MRKKETEMQEVRSGIWQHYKGKRYLVLGVARHTETNEEVVVYVPLYEHPNGGRPLQVRPVSMWYAWIDPKTGENVDIGQPGVQRFTHFGPELETLR